MDDSYALTKSRLAKKDIGDFMEKRMSGKPGILIDNIDKIHTTQNRADRIRKNLQDRC